MNILYNKTMNDKLLFLIRLNPSTSDKDTGLPY